VFLSFKLTAFILPAALNEHQGSVNRSLSSMGTRPYRRWAKCQSIGPVSSEPDRM